MPRLFPHYAFTFMSAGLCGNGLLHYIHLADASIQSNLQVRNTIKAEWSSVSCQSQEFNQQNWLN